MGNSYLTFVYLRIWDPKKLNLLSRSDLRFWGQHSMWGSNNRCFGPPESIKNIQLFWLSKKHLLDPRKNWTPKIDCWGPKINFWIQKKIRGIQKSMFGTIFYIEYQFLATKIVLWTKRTIVGSKHLFLSPKIMF